MAVDFEAKKRTIASQIEKDKQRIETLKGKIEQIKSDSSKINILNSFNTYLVDAERNLRVHQSIYEYMRPNAKEDVEKRIKILKEFPSAVKESIPDNIPLVFHGTKNIGTVLQIIKTGGLLTPEQKGESYTSFASQIDVTYKNDINVTCEFAEPGILDSYLPYGAIFAFTPLDEEIDIVVKTKGTEVAGGVDGVRFTDEPDRLFSIITTSENKQKIEEWCEEYGWPNGKVTTHEEFIEKCKTIYQINNIPTQNIKDVDLAYSFFHFTSKENFQSIQKHGLKANIGGASEIVNEDKPRVYMSKGGKGILEIKNSFIHKFKGLKICDLPLEYREYFKINDFSSTEQVSEEIVYEAMENKFKNEIYFKVDAIEGEDFLPEDFLPEEFIGEIRTSKGFRDVKGKENHDIDVKKLTLLTSDKGSTALDITEYLYNRLLENAKKQGKENFVRSTCSDLDGLFEYIKQKNLCNSDKKITPEQAVNNALNEGTTTDKFYKTKEVKQLQLNSDKNKGVAKE